MQRIISEHLYLIQLISFICDLASLYSVWQAGDIHLEGLYS